MTDKLTTRLNQIGDQESIAGLSKAWEQRGLLIALAAILGFRQ
jgi:hypothetical protein